MQRRDFLGVLGGAVAWPLSARAQQPEPTRRIAVLTGYAANDPLSQPRIAAFLQGLSELGWSDSRNLQIDYRWTGADVEQIKEFAKELVALEPDVILAQSTPVTAALQRETTGIPIVFVIRVRSCRCRLCRQPSAARWQHYRLHQFRRVNGRQVAGAAQRGRASG